MTRRSARLREKAESSIPSVEVWIPKEVKKNKKIEAAASSADAKRIKIDSPKKMIESEPEESLGFEYEDEEDDDFGGSPGVSDFSFDEDDEDEEVALHNGGGDGDEFKPEESLKEKIPLVQFKYHTTKELAQKLGAQTKNISDVLQLTDDEALILLQFYSWNSERLMEEYMDDPERVKANAGVVDGGSKSHTSLYKKYPQHDFGCFICCEDKDDSYQLSCGHEYCMDCYRRYVKDKTSSGKVIKCPDCDVALDSHDLEFIGGEGESFKLIESSIREWVERHKAFKWCPAPDCDSVVEVLNLSDIPNIVKNQQVPVATCNHGHQFCIACNFENHNPTPCQITKEWITKCKDDSETVNWIMSNTKQCPKCDSSIEKNGGCNHMTCKKCGNEFCWICMGDWKAHGSSFYQCNRFNSQTEEQKKDINSKANLANASKTSLKRYLHYYNLFAIHEASTNQDFKRCKFVEDKVRELQETSGISWIEAQFLVESAETLLKARKVLKWSYAFAYYCDRNNFLDLFESIQAGLSDAVENLSKLFEIEEPLEIVKQKLEFLNKSRYLGDRQNAMISCTQEAIKNGTLNNKST